MMLWFPDVDSKRDKGHLLSGFKGWNGAADNIKNNKVINSFKQTLFNNMFHMNNCRII